MESEDKMMELMKYTNQILDGPICNLPLGILDPEAPETMWKYYEEVIKDLADSKEEEDSQLNELKILHEKGIKGLYKLNGSCFGPLPAR